MKITATTKFNLCLPLAFMITAYTSCGFANLKPQPRYNNKYNRVYDYKYSHIQDCTAGSCHSFFVVGSLVGGAAFVKPGQSESFVYNGVTYQYDPDSSGLNRAMWGATVGEEFRFNETWILDLTAGYYQIATFDVEGVLTQGSVAYNYQYAINSKQYLLEAKVLGNSLSGFHVYGLFGVGGAFNRLGNYATSPVVIDTPQYSSNTNFNFSYSVGLGVEYDLWRYMRIGLGYRFMGLGPAKFETATVNGVPVSAVTGQNALNAQEAIVQLSFLI